MAAAPAAVGALALQTEDAHVLAALAGQPPDVQHFLAPVDGRAAARFLSYLPKALWAQVMARGPLTGAANPSAVLEMRMARAHGGPLVAPMDVFIARNELGGRPDVKVYLASLDVGCLAYVLGLGSVKGACSPLDVLEHRAKLYLGRREAGWGAGAAGGTEGVRAVPGRGAVHDGPGGDGGREGQVDPAAGRGGAAPPWSGRGEGGGGGVGVGGAEEAAQALPSLSPPLIPGGPPPPPARGWAPPAPPHAEPVPQPIPHQRADVPQPIPQPVPAGSSPAKKRRRQTTAVGPAPLTFAPKPAATPAAGSSVQVKEERQPTRTPVQPRAAVKEEPGAAVKEEPGAARGAPSAGAAFGTSERQAAAAARAQSDAEWRARQERLTRERLTRGQPQPQPQVQPQRPEGWDLLTPEERQMSAWFQECLIRSRRKQAAAARDAGAAVPVKEEPAALLVKPEAVKDEPCGRRADAGRRGVR